LGRKDGWGFFDFFPLSVGWQIHFRIVVFFAEKECEKIFTLFSLVRGQKLAEPQKNIFFFRI
jgi:hypothetical protein